MLTFYYGISFDFLADDLIELLRSDPLSDPLAQERLVVQNHGMARWLSLRTAAETGIAANMKFRFPAEEVWDIYRSMDSGIPGELPSDRAPMTWSIYRVLENLPDKNPYRSLWQYMRNKPGEWDPLKSWKLAERIGDVFDLYLNYRPDMLTGWEEVSITALPPEESWQAGIWKRLNEIWIEANPGLHWYHRPQIHREFMKRLRNEKISASSLPGRLNLFGLSGLPPQSIELFVGVSSVIDVHWFGLDLVGFQPKHPLVESWGSEGRDFIQLFDKYVSSTKTRIKRVNVDAGRDEAGSTVSFLMPRENSSGGPDIQVHACHSPLREVEVLHDRLLDILQNSPGLTVDDILVLIPDLESYAPFIEAVFGTGEENFPELPFHFVNRAGGVRREVFRTFSALLHILEGRFKVTEIVDLLSSQVVLDRLDVDREELDQLIHWIGEAKIRWGVDGDHKAVLGLPETSFHTWQAGIDRMMMGFASDFEIDLFEGIYPLAGIESGDDADLLGKLLLFYNALKKARIQVQKERTPAEWGSILSGWIRAFISEKSRYSVVFSELRNLVDRLSTVADQGSFQQPVRFSIIREQMEEKLMTDEGRGGYYGHGVTFCGPDQMRNIPYKAICMIGMNNAAYPRVRLSPHFDLMSDNPRPGDRSRREGDRYLFLETLNAATESLYFSYTGQSNLDDSALLPSVMISELLDFLAGSRGCTPLDLVQRHPLHAHSSRYFSGDENKLFSYSSIRYEVSKEVGSDISTRTLFLEERLPDAGSEFSQLSFSDLVRFYENPSRYILQERLGIYLREESVINDEREPMELKGLARYQLSEELLELYLKEAYDIDDYKSIARAKGMLPDGWIGEQAFLETRNKVFRFCGEVRPLMELPAGSPKEVELELGEFRIYENLDNLKGNFQLFIKYGKSRAKYLIMLWIYHLALQESDSREKRSVLITREEEGPRYFILPRVGNARDILADLVDFYRQGIHKEIPFFAESSFAYAYESMVKGKDHNTALSSAYKKWENSWNPELGESRDPYINKIFQHKEPIGTEEFKIFSLNFWRPVLEFLMEGEEHLVEV